MDEVEIKQATFEGWAVIEMMGHRKETGFVLTQAFGQAVLFRVDVPELAERDYVLESPEYRGRAVLSYRNKSEAICKPRAVVSHCARFALCDQPLLRGGGPEDDRAQHSAPADHS